MRLKPNDSPVMELNEKRNASFKLAGAVGTNSISSATVESDTLTIGTVSTSGTTVSCPITASQTGTHTAKCTANLSSGETVIGVIRVKVIDSTQCETSRTDYN